MDNLEKNLRKIKIKEISEEDKESLWHGIMVKRLHEERQQSRLLAFNVFNLNMKKLIAGVIAIVVTLGGTGVVAASNNAIPGDLLFPVELAIEKLQIKLANEEKKVELRLQFTEERITEIKEVSEEKSVPVSSLVANLSEAKELEIEADVFINETIVKIEADNKNYGYSSALKTKTELIKEISSKYSVSEEKVLAVIDFETEDRDSRADDKEFLNKTHSINFSEKESEDVSQALNEIEEFLNEDDENDDAGKEELSKSLSELLVLLGDEGKLEIKRDDGKIKIEVKNDGVEIKMKVKENKSDNDDDDLNGDSDDSISNDDAEEDDSEVFCRGGWREAEDCDDNDESDDLDDDDSDDSNEEEIDN